MGHRLPQGYAPTRILAVWLGLVAAAAGLAPATAVAALGGDLASIERDHAQLAGARVVTPTVAYDLHELTAPGGTRVREYLDRGGRVFAVSWQGPRLPDLGQLLGAYAEHYAAAVRGHRATRHGLSVATPELVLTATRLPRGFSGQALLLKALPEGVRREDLR